MDPALVEALGRGLPAERLVADPDVVAAISHDDAEWAPTGQAAVASPGSTWRGCSHDRRR